MKITAWIQMGCERREVAFDVTEAEMERVGLPPRMSARLEHGW